MKKFLSAILALAMTLSCFAITAVAAEVVPEITKQPTVDDLSVKVNVTDNVSYQWYSGESTIGTIDDTIARPVQGSEMIPDGVSSYDENTGSWTATSDGDGYFEFFFIDLEKNESITVTFDTDVIADDFGIGCYDTGIACWGVENEDGSVTFTAEAAGEYVLMGMSEAETITAVAVGPSYVFSAIEGETESKLSEYDIGGIYYCKITVGDTVLVSNAVKTELYILHQPTATEPYASLSLPDRAKGYQWLSASDAIYQEITNYNAVPTDSDMYIEDLSFFDCTVINEVSSYDEENKWTPASIGIIAPIIMSESASAYADYDLYFFSYFSVYLQAGSVVNVTFSEDIAFLSAALCDYESESEIQYDLVLSEEDGSSYSATIEENGNYSLLLLTQTDISEVTVTAYGDVAEFTAIEGETESALSEMEKGVTYRCAITLDDDSHLITDPFLAKYAIIKQPTADSISVNVTFEEDVSSYYWYTAEKAVVTVTEDNAYTATNDTDSYYDYEKQCWVPSLYGIYQDDDGIDYYEYDCFDIYIEAGDTLAVTPSRELKDDEITYLSDEYVKNEFECVDGVYYFTSEVSQYYYIYLDTYYEDITVTAELMSKFELVSLIEGANGKGFLPTEDGSYICVIEYTDGTVLVSDAVTANAMLLGDVDGNGEIDQYDYLYVKRAYFDTYTLDENEALRADVNEDKSIDQLDYLLIKRAYFGTYTIE